LEQYFVENDVNDLENIRNMCSLKNRFIILFSFTKYYYFSLLQVNLQFPMMTILFKYSESILLSPCLLFAIYQNNLEQIFVENDVNDLENIRNMCSENLKKAFEKSTNVQ
jgi:hypothetical protein